MTGLGSLSKDGMAEREVVRHSVLFLKVSCLRLYPLKEVVCILD